MLRTSQSGRISENGGRMRPVIALNCASGNAGHARQHADRVADAPQATGAVLASRQSVAAWNGLKPSPMRNAPAIATGAPPPPVPSRNAPKQNAISTSCSRLSDGQCGDRVLHHLELPGLDGDVVEEDRRDDDPGDAGHAEHDPAARRPDECRRHAEDQQGPSYCDHHPANAATQTRWLSTTSTKKSVMTGNAAIAVETGQAFSGS